MHLRTIRSVALSAALLVCMAGCNMDESSATDPSTEVNVDGEAEPNGSKSDAADQGPIESADWEDVSTDSLVEGRITKKRLSVHVSDIQTFVVEASCADATKSFQLTVTSAAADGTATDQYAFVYGHTGIGQKFVRGLAKVNLLSEPIGVDQVVRPHHQFDNVITVVPYGALMKYRSQLGLNYINKPAPNSGYIAGFLPIALQISTGNGQFEFAIPQSNEIEEVLAVCGMAHPTLEEFVAADKKAAEEEVAEQQLREAQRAVDEAEYEMRKRELESLSNAESSSAPRKEEEK